MSLESVKLLPMKIARVSSTSRRHVEIIIDEHQSVLAKKSSRHLEPCVGDLVSFYLEDGEYVVDSIEERTNCLSRSYGKKTKRLATNLDLILILTAPEPLFNAVFIDRVLAAASCEGIPCALIANKADLKESFEKTKSKFLLYQNLSLPLYQISAKEKLNLKSIKTLLELPEHSCIAITGVSGVGKSSLLNALIPEAAAQTNEVSLQGQGKQTTSQSFGYLYPRETQDLLLIDLPGIQNFGVCHLSEEQIRAAFTEFSSLDPTCKFANCKHINEPDCAVLVGIKEGKIEKSRYQSYRNMLEELEENREY